MKKLIFVLAIILCASTAGAWTLQWDAITGVDGYKLYYQELGATVFAEVDVGTATEYDLTPLNLVEGTRYEFFVTAEYQGSVAGESDHIRWTMPVPPQIVEIEELKRLTLEFK